MIAIGGRSKLTGYIKKKFKQDLTLASHLQHTSLDRESQNY